MADGDLWPERASGIPAYSIYSITANVSSPNTGLTFTLPAQARGVFLATMHVEPAQTAADNEPWIWTGIVSFYASKYTAASVNRVRKTTALQVAPTVADGVALGSNAISDVSLSDPSSAGVLTATVTFLGGSVRSFVATLKLLEVRGLDEFFLLARSAYPSI